MIRTPSWPSTAVAACASASASARAARKSSRPRRSRPSAASNSRGEAHQLAHVGEARLAGAAHQHREVVAGLGDRGLDQLGERQRAGAARAGSSRVAAKRRSSARSSSGICSQPLARRAPRPRRGRPPLDRRPEVAPAAGRRAQQPERVGGDPAGRRGERAEQRLVVERVGDRRQQRADVGDLLLGPVAAPADDVGAQPGALQRVLVGVEVGEGAQQHDHRRRARRPASASSRRRAARNRASASWFGGVRASVAGSSSIALLVPAVARGQQHLDRGPLAGGGVGARGAAPTRSGR